MNTHNLGRPFECPHYDCPYASKTYKLMNDHVRRVHLVQLKPCEVCGKMIKGSKNMRQHMQSVHSDSKEARTIPCSMCSRFFSCMGSLARHKSRHENARLYECALCNKRYCIPIKTLLFGLRFYEKILCHCFGQVSANLTFIVYVF
jgi:uncharacterized Zn-finger protein